MFYYREAEAIGKERTELTRGLGSGLTSERWCDGANNLNALWHCIWFLCCNQVIPWPVLLHVTIFIEGGLGTLEQRWKLKTTDGTYLFLLLHVTRQLFGKFPSLWELFLELREHLLRKTFIFVLRMVCHEIKLMCTC